MSETRRFEIFRKKSKTGSGRLPSLFGQTLVKSEFDYRREMRRKLERIQHDNRGTVRRRIAQDHMFAQGHLSKRYQWFTVDKSYRDSCRTMWDRQAADNGRSSHLLLPNIYSPDTSSSLTMSSINTFNTKRDENTILLDEKIKQDFLHVQPVMLEIIRAPHSSLVLKHKHEIEARKRSAEQRQAHIQTTAQQDDRYVHLVSSLQEVWRIFFFLVCAVTYSLNRHDSHSLVVRSFTLEKNLRHFPSTKTTDSRRHESSLSYEQHRFTR